jgi:hypothetical protein
MVKDNGYEWLRCLTKEGGVTLPNHTQSHPHPTQITETTGVLKTSLALPSAHPRILVVC